jgi:hypothetical protein
MKPNLETPAADTQSTPGAARHESTPPALLEEGAAYEQLTHGNGRPYGLRPATY